MKDVIIRNIERLLQLDADGEREQIEPMSEWKWNQLYKIVVRYGIGPWVADGLKAYQDDFFLQMPSSLHQKFMLLQGEKDPARLQRYLLQIDRSMGVFHRFTKRSLEAYAHELIKNIKNVEE